MIDNINLSAIEKLLNNRKIINSKLLSDSFNINCYKIETSDNNKLIVKFYKERNNKFNAISAEIKNLKFFEKFKINNFPKIKACNDDYLIMTYIENDNGTKELITLEQTDTKFPTTFDIIIEGPTGGTAWDLFSVSCPTGTTLHSSSVSDQGTLRTIFHTAPTFDLRPGMTVYSDDKSTKLLELKEENHYLINEEYNVDTIDEKSQIEDFENLDNTILDFSESNPFGDAGKES